MLHARLAPISLFFLGVLAACGSPSSLAPPSTIAGAGTASSLAMATPSAVASAGPTPIPLPSGVISAVGQIAAISGAKITIQAGTGCGFMNVYTTGTTVYFDGAPQIGQYAAFTGAGTHCAGITAANSVSLSSTAFTPSVTTGKVSLKTPFGFRMIVAAKSIPVALTSSSVVFGSALVVGSRVTVTALGTPATGLTATQVAVSAPPTPTPDPSVSPSPTPTPVARHHVMTFAYAYGYAGAPATVPINAFTRYVNWTMTDEAHAAMLREAHVKVQVYANFWRNYTTDNPAVGYTDLKPGGAHAAAEARDCSNNVITDSSYGGGYEADARAAAALGHAQAVAQYRLAQYAGAYDALFSDDAGAVGGITPPCGYAQSTYDAQVNAVHAALLTPTFVNALGGAPDPSQAVDMVNPPNVLGAMCEQCYTTNSSTGDKVQLGTAWQNVENAEIATIVKEKIFWLYARATGPASSESGLRMYAFASFLLTYSPNYAMFQEALSTPSGFPVMPEAGFVPFKPRTTETNVSGYIGPGGAYLREFAACYYHTYFVNSCAVVVNPTTGAVPVPTTSYAHSLVLMGGGVLDGGTVRFNGPAIKQLEPGSAAILLP